MNYYAFAYYAFGALMLLCGILVFSGKTRLIHDYHWANVRDLPRYGRAIGKPLAGIGLFSVASGTASFFTNNPQSICLWIFLTGFAAMFVWIYFVQKKYNGGMFG